MEKKKTKINKINWLNHPKNKPSLGDEIVVCYGKNSKKEIVFWEFRHQTLQSEFKWFKMPELPLPPQP